MIGFGQDGINNQIEAYVSKKVNVWQQKNQFEKIFEYQLRVNEGNRNKVIKKYQEEALDSIKRKHIQELLPYQNRNSNFVLLIELKEYDAENEVFLCNSSQLGEFIVQVPIKKAKSFKKRFEVLMEGAIIQESIHLLHEELSALYQEMGAASIAGEYVSNDKIQNATILANKLDNTIYYGKEDGLRQKLKQHMQLYQYSNLDLAELFSNLDFIILSDRLVLSHLDVILALDPASSIKNTFTYDIPNNICTSGDCENGYGAFTSLEGTYKGNWKDGRVHGNGIFEGNEYTYDGKYVNGKKHGQGKKTYINGTIEEGLFENGEFVGE